MKSKSILLSCAKGAAATVGAIVVVACVCVAWQVKTAKSGGVHYA